jgi:hypothetical protein
VPGCGHVIRVWCLGMSSVCGLRASHRCVVFKSAAGTRGRGQDHKITRVPGRRGVEEARNRWVQQEHAYISSKMCNTPMVCRKSSSKRCNTPIVCRKSESLHSVAP